MKGRKIRTVVWFQARERERREREREREKQKERDREQRQIETETDTERERRGCMFAPQLRPNSKHEYNILT